jgi:hypothetical protein
MLPFAMLLFALPPAAAAAAQNQGGSSATPPVMNAAATQAAAVAPTPALDQPNPKVPGLISRWSKGFNAGFTFTGLHDSGTGYSTLFTVAAAYTFNDTYSMDVDFPLYLYRLAPSIAVNPPPSQLLVEQQAEPGDVDVGLHGQWINHIFDYLGTFSFTAPTGDETYGLSTGRFTLDYTNHFEHVFGIFTPDMEIGMGDSSALANQTITEDYTSLGPLAHFQAGSSVDLYRGTTFSADAYEQLPLGDQKIYQSIRHGRIFVTEVTGTNVSEDNGFITSLDIPLNHHVILSGYYSRSLRLHADTAAGSVTYTFRRPPPNTMEGGNDTLFR